MNEVRLDTNFVDYPIVGDVLHRRPRRRLRRQALHQDQPRLLPVGALAAGLDHRSGVHLRQPRRDRGPGHGRQRRPVRRRDGQLLLDRRDPGHGVPRPGDDAVLLRLEGPLGPRVPAAALQRALARLQLVDVRGRDDPDRRREPVRARARPEAAAGLADHRRHRRRGGHRRRLHHARRPVVGDLQRGAAVLRDPRGADPDHRRSAWSTSAAGAACRTRSRSPRSARPACTRCRAPTPATSRTRSGRAGSGSCSASASCSRSATGRRTSPRSSARCRPRTCRPPSGRR